MDVARLKLPLLLLACAAGCTKPREDPAPVAPVALDRLERAKFNRNALELMLPLFWQDDTTNPGVLDPTELAVVWGIGDSSPAEWVTEAGFTARFRQAYDRIAARAAEPKASDARLAALEKELDQGRFTLTVTDVRGVPPGEQEAIQHVLAAARIVDELFARQVGGAELRAGIPTADTLSQLVFYLNHGPWCSGPATEADPSCNALASRPQRVSGLYPASLQEKADFCDTLATREDAAATLGPFSVVTLGSEGEPKPVPYSKAYADLNRRAAAELRAAATALGEEEAAFRRYLVAAAAAFEDNDWFAADEAWAAMNAKSSKYYLRIGPDEVYFEPCNRKAGFHASFARINPKSVAWQTKLEPVKNEMERVLAAKAGAPYAARTVTFQLPDFIDIIINAGDSRGPRGGTAGQSLPNWGPVANENRGRTVVVTNLFNDPDSNETKREQAASVFCADSVGLYEQDQEAGLLSTVLHEAAHNLGPAHDYQVGGKTDDQIFGGKQASILEELKAQTSALYFAIWLHKKGLVSAEMATQAHVSDIAWAMRHVSRGMFDAEGNPKTYSQLAGVQLAHLLKKGVLAWRPNETAANGRDRGCVSLDLTGMEAAIDELLRRSAGIKARGDARDAEALLAEMTDEKAPWQPLFAAVTERWRRYPQPSVVYSVRFQR